MVTGQKDASAAIGESAMLIRYQVLAANRRHFSGLFFAVVAFSWSFGLAVWVTIKWAQPNTPALAHFVTGSILGVGAFVAQRLLKRERSSFNAMCTCWDAISGRQPITANRAVLPGAMAIVVVGQFIVGAMMLTVGAALI